jgi:hypothetical protein
VITLPPSEAGAVQETVDEPFSPELAVTAVGAPGVVAESDPGVNALEAADAGPLPTELVATTVNV